MSCVPLLVTEGHLTFFPFALTLATSYPIIFQLQVTVVILSESVSIQTAKYCL